MQKNIFTEGEEYPTFGGHCRLLKASSATGAARERNMAADGLPWSGFAFGPACTLDTLQLF